MSLWFWFILFYLVSSGATMWFCFFFFFFFLYPVVTGYKWLFKLESYFYCIMSFLWHLALSLTGSGSSFVSFVPLVTILGITANWPVIIKILRIHRIKSVGSVSWMEEEDLSKKIFFTWDAGWGVKPVAHWKSTDSWTGREDNPTGETR